jgi:integrase
MSKVLKLTVSAPLTWEEVLEEFLLQKQAEGKAERTIRDYRNHVKAFFSNQPEAWGDYHGLKLAVRKHFSSLTCKSATTYNLRREYLKAFFSWCVKEGYLPGSPVDGLPKRKNEGRPRSIPKDVLKRLLSLPDKNTYTGIRDTALILLQADSGLRPGEALRLTPSCFNLKMLEVEVPSYAAKTRESRTVVISPQTAKAIQKLLLVRPPDWTEEVPVFASQDGTPLPCPPPNYKIVLALRRTSSLNSRDKDSSVTTSTSLPTASRKSFTSLTCVRSDLLVPGAYLIRKSTSLASFASLFA